MGKKKKARHRYCDFDLKERNPKKTLGEGRQKRYNRQLAVLYLGEKKGP